MQNLDSIDLSATQRRAVMKLAVELVKADDRIHSKEVAVLDKLQSGLGLDQEELDLTHYRLWRVQWIVSRILRKSRQGASSTFSTR